MGNQIDTSKNGGSSKPLYGREVIYCKENLITKENVIEVLKKAMETHRKNSSDTDYLYKYYKGKQPILRRLKKIRPDICNKIVVNIANEIVSFKTGYLCGEPIQYVRRNGDDKIGDWIETLNEFMFAEDKASKDQELVRWQMICGTSYRCVLPDKPQSEDEAPFEIYTLDPRNTFVVYSSGIGNEPVMAGTFSTYKDTNVTTYSVYTKNHYFLIEDDKIISDEEFYLKDIPIIEYPANGSRLGAFEIVVPLLDAINNIESNRLDGVEQFIQSYWKFVGCKLDMEKFEEFKEAGAILVPPNDNGGKIDIDLVTKELNQTQIQTLKNDIYNEVLTICGMPNRNGGSSTSDTGAAVLLRDGWSDAEARAKDSENEFKRAEKRMLKIVLTILRESKETKGFKLLLKNIDMQFTRRNYEAIQSKSQVLVSMLQQDKIHPQLAFIHSGMFTDPEMAYNMSMEYYEANKEQQSNNQNITVTEDLNDVKLGENQEKTQWKYKHRSFKKTRRN